MRHVLLIQLVGHCVLVVGWNVHAVFELVADDHVLDKCTNDTLDARLIFPLRERAVHRWLAARGTKSEVASAKPLAAIKDEHLMPQVTDAVAVWCC